MKLKLLETNTLYQKVLFLKGISSNFNVQSNLEIDKKLTKPHQVF